MLELQLLIKIDPNNEEIFEKFDQFIKSIETQKLEWEKAHFIFAQYLDLLERNRITDLSFKIADREREFEWRQRLKNCIYNYLKSVGFGNKYIWQSLPRALELWFD